ncbi:tyrosine-type recombinase/integrase [Thiopseudomonas alkaliphila]|uniref:tyrosine-type recombinase/integrase n=1 Tax=Thiopseudomonas alkaliphila TaxID=1697053 RepID=UPI002576A5F6|nr:site-specific integrase [Thiopseudomonas alkaliphila]MDM1707694.1 integrase arm-type DNA-binding domain-containing protein [Thiopseudomonas alkaliphila]
MSTTKKIKATSAKGVTALISQGAIGMHAAGNGLYLRVRSKGAASWVFRYMLNGIARNMGLGSTVGLTLAEAKAEAVRLRAQLARGIDPLNHREEERRLANTSKLTFDEVAADYIKAQRSSWTSEKHAEQWVSTLRDYATPVIGHLAPADITTEHILKVLTPIWNSKKETASRVRNRIELVLDAAKVRKLRNGENVAAWRGHLELLLANHKKNDRRHHPALNWNQISEFWRVLNQERDASSQALQLTILTALRTKEVLGARWQEFDLKAAIWTIPAERMKAKREQRVPLSSAMLDLLAKLPRVPSGLLFEGRSAGKPISNMAMLKKCERLDAAKYKTDGIGWRDNQDQRITPHGFRSTFRDWAAENTSFENIVVEQALAHTIGNAVEAAYRRGDLLERRRELMEAWGAYVTRPIGHNVRQLREA